jgi:PncC family amidohydrolase
MHAMFGRSVAPAVVRPEGVAVRVRLARHVGIGESAAAAKLGDVLERGRNPQVGITASDGVITTRSRYVGPEGGAEAALFATDEAIAERLGEYRFSDGEAGLFERALELLKEQRGAIVTAESCTGGLIASRLTEIAGSSAAVVGGFVVYSNEMKAEMLGVDEGLIVEHGAVSAEVARSLALGALRQAPYDGLYDGEGGPASVHALAVTGIAGPGGAVEGKPVGTVFVAHGVAAVNAGGASVNDATVYVRRFLFPGDRERVRDRTATAAAAMLVMDLLGRRPETLLWQVHLDGSHPGR